MQSWEYILSVLPEHPAKGLTQAHLRRMHGYSRNSILRIMYYLCKNKLATHSSNKPYKYWKKKTGGCTRMMVTRDLRKLLDNSINSEICVWVGNSKLEGLLISWNESEIVIYSESHDQLSIMDMGKVDTVGIKVPDGVNHVKIVEMIGEEHADQEIVSEK